MVQQTVCINKEAINDLIKLKEEFDMIIESIELMGNKKFIDSYNKSKEQVKKREFANWDAL